MGANRKIPYGVINWAEIVRECFFVDNTAYIRELESCKTPVFLRPKRFGKSVVCSMLAHYYDVNLKDRFEELFGKTDIGRNPTPHNSTICNWYLFNFVSYKGRQPPDVIDANVRTDIGWFRRLAQTNPRALEKLRGYVERGEGEDVNRSALSAKFGRAKFFSEEFFPYALYYLGLLTFEDAMTFNIPNLAIKKMIEVCGSMGYNWFDLSA